MKDLALYTDAHGFTGHIESDGRLHFGDGLQRLGFRAMAEWSLLNTSWDAEEKIEIETKYFRCLGMIWPDLSKDEPRRYWSFDQWYGNYGTVSCDQIEPNIYFLLLIKDFVRAQNIFKNLASRRFFAWNYKKIGQQDDDRKMPDFVLFRLMPAMLRAFRLYPLVWLWDIFLIPKAIFRILWPMFKRDDTGDDLNFIAQLQCFREVHPTVFSWFAREIYFYFRPCLSPHDVFGPISALNQYFENEGAPPLNMLWERVLLQDWFNG